MQIGYCPAISLVGETSVSGSIYAMDCHVDAAVRVGYERLFGAGGAFGYVLTAMLIIYVALIAIGFLTGRTSLTLTMMSPRIMTMVLVLTFVTFWPAYHAIFYGLMMGGPDEVAAALLGQRGSAVMNFARSLDGLFAGFSDIAKRLEPTDALTSPTSQPLLVLPQSMPVKLFWLSGLCLLVSTLGVLILTRLVLYLLLILGPIFILFALFPQTRGLFNGWLRTTLVFALAPLLAVLGGTAALALFVPLIEAIGSDPQAAVKSVQPMVILFIGSTIYCAFLFTLMWVAASLVRDWHAALREKPAGGLLPPAYSFAAQAPASTPSPISPAGQALSGSFERTAPMVSILSRAADGAAHMAGTSQPLMPGAGRGHDDRPSSHVGADRFDRVRGLGQRFRNQTAIKLTPLSPKGERPL